MLRFDMAEVLRTPGMRQVLEINEAPYTDEDVEYVSPVTGRVTVTNTGSMLLVRGPVRATIELECSRCLEPVRAQLELILEEEFDLKVAEEAVHRHKSIQVVEEELVRAFQGPVLCVDVLIRQAALLAAPLQPLCRETCPGIPVTEVEPAPEAHYENAPFRDLSKLLKE